ncbi:hypothetical protein CI105_08255, partial [Candidatus Izimaplasma bacterium ZiA1]|uniref:TetR/AcrR family transcriptional regulator n=1 Tax=Candidatus Izimoplasma sp. ZiA1 TaxID=2024899 RepID=UPI000BD7DAF7
MPKNAFFNISEEKRKRFIEVSIDEFTTKSFETVSVNSIIKRLDIPRGSFYSYFENLEDLFTYLFKSIREDRIIYARTLVNDSNNDYFTFIKKLFAYDFDKFKSECKYSLFRNYIHYIQFTKKKSIKDLIVIDGVQGIANGLRFDEVFNIKQYRITSDEFLDVIELIIVIMIN